jgi:hypothetical protein
MVVVGIVFIAIGLEATFADVLIKFEFGSHSPQNDILPLQIALLVKHCPLLLINFLL